MTCFWPTAWDYYLRLAAKMSIKREDEASWNFRSLPYLFAADEEGGLADKFQ